MSATPERSPPSSRALTVVGAVVLGLVGLLAGFVAATLVFSLVVAFDPSLEQNRPLQGAISTIGMGIGLVSVAAFYLERNGLSWSYLRVRRPTFRDLGWAVGVTVALFAALVVVDQLGLAASEHSIAEEAEQDPTILLPLIPLAILVTGPAEELLYRGVIQTRLREVFDTAAAVVIAAAIFSIVHVPAYGATGGLDASLFITLGILFLLGSFLGYAYERTDNLVVPAVAHGLFNAVMYGGNYLSSMSLV